MLRATTAYSVPTELRAHLDYVGGVTRFPQFRRRPPVPVQQAQGNAPVLLANHQGAGQVQLFWALLCQDGTPATNYTMPCSPSPQVIAFTIDAVPQDPTGRASAMHLAPAYYYITGYEVQCLPGSAWPQPFAGDAAASQFGLQAVYCLATLGGFSDFVPYNVTLTTWYADQTQSQTLQVAQLLVTLPWTDLALLRALYSVPPGTLAAGTSQAVVEFLGEYFSPQDLAQFLAANGLSPDATPVTVWGANNASEPGGEASLDIQLLAGLAPAGDSTFFYQDGLDVYNGQEPFEQWVETMANASQPPLVQSVSYGDMEYNLSLAYRLRVDQEFQKLGLRGVSLLVASGDDGVGGDDARGNSSYCGACNPSWPASSPYVTSVGGSVLSRQSLGVCQAQGPGGLAFACAEESALREAASTVALGSRITSGGGFSDYAARPAYQNASVQAYLAAAEAQGLLPPPSYFNRSGRAYPDLAANAHNYVIYLGGQALSVDGTSASAPVVAALISLINAALAELDRPPMGFLNPWLYAAAAAHPAAFQDLVQGDNRCTANLSICCQYGFFALPAWDAVTGLGTPNLLTLRNLALNPAQPFPEAGSQFVYQETHGEMLDRIGLLVGVVVLGAIAILLLIAVFLLYRRGQATYQPIIS